MECYRGWHLALALAVGIPGLLLWSVGVPLAVASYLTRHRARLAEPLFTVNFGFLYSEYREEAYYHECMVYLRKLGIVAALVLMPSIGRGIQLLAIMAVMVGCTLLQVTH